MNRITSALVRFYKDEEAATAVEYGLLAALIAAAIIGTVTTLGTNISGNFNNIASKIPAGH